ncbi:sensor histidine kinase [Brachybacterium saurashtrense]|uniref:Histidine kinase n=1 Tax=Brachybacterium saurashtrense TaxID=556288 RepID=A0A345YSM3_9MICO|nr:histidine kinase [Brachybacterium saurashtrense]AXK46925.1 histidine kinase [Brachybacterium saurashtrense]RRR22640.1 histidine kinase [Brachybacterium saurashtrense]
METSTGRQWSVFYAYTAWSVVVLIVLIPLGVALLLDTRVPELLVLHPAATAVLIAQIALSAWSGHRALAGWSRAELPADRDRWDLPHVGRLPSDWTLAATALLTVVLAIMQLIGDDGDEVLLISLSLLIASAIVRWRWEVGAVGAVATGMIAALLGHSGTEAIAVGALVAGLVLSIRLSLWLAAMVRELDDARDAQARLAVAEERLRFARDLHDVTGRDLSVIAVKAELVAQLAEREDSRAVEHGREVAQIARASLAEIRALVRGYREADLATELQGTASLLRSARAGVTVHGDADDVPAQHRDTAAWVLREGGTNILRHADPSTITITLGAGGLTLVNDGAPGDDTVAEGSGLTGMRERLGAGSSLDVRRQGGVFTLDVRFDAPEGTR